MKLLPARLGPVADRLENVLIEVHEGRLDPRQAQAMASVAGMLLKIVSTAEIEQRLRALEARAKEEGAGRRWRV